jgi:superfamily II DNA or RNA helicase
MISESSTTTQEQSIGKQLYAYQHKAIEEILSRLKDHPARYNLLYQLPTGGGKTVIFSEIARRYIANTVKKC